MKLKTIISYPIEKGKNKPLYDILIICLTAERNLMYDRINKRVDLMIEAGLVDEVKSLREDGYKAMQIGYKEINNYLDGLYDLNTAIEEIKKNTRHYAKRQITWFKNQMNAHMIDIKQIKLQFLIRISIISAVNLSIPGQSSLDL